MYFLPSSVSMTCQTSLLDTSYPVWQDVWRSCWPRRSMDRTEVSGTSDVGSIPTGAIKNHLSGSQTSGFCFRETGNQGVKAEALQQCPEAGGRAMPRPRHAGLPRVRAAGRNASRQYNARY